MGWPARIHHNNHWSNRSQTTIRLEQGLFIVPQNSANSGSAVIMSLRVAHAPIAGQSARGFTWMLVIENRFGAICRTMK